jgi:hypothetical protein
VRWQSRGGSFAEGQSALTETRRELAEVPVAGTEGDIRVINNPTYLVEVEVEVLFLEGVIAEACNVAG